MQIKGGDLVGIKAYSQKTGNVVEDIDAVVYEPNSQIVKGFVLKESGMFGGQVVLMDDVIDIQKDRVVISSEEAIVPMDKVVEKTTDESAVYLSDKEVRQGNQTIGKLADIIFDTESGKAKKFVVSRVIDGKQETTEIPINEVEQIGNDVIKKPAQAFLNKLKEPFAPSEDTIIGQYVTKNILSPNDHVIAKRGDMITHELVNIAKTQQVFDQITQNVSAKPVQ